MIKKNRRHYKVETLMNRELVDHMLTNGYTYDDIVDAVKQNGEKISRSAIQRYHASFEFAAEKIRRVREQAKVLIDELRENPGTEMAEVANQVMMHGLLERVATASDEFDKLSLEQAGKLIATLERSGVGRERLKLQYEKMLKTARNQIETELKRELSDQPDILTRITELVDKIINNIIDEK